MNERRSFGKLLTDCYVAAAAGGEGVMMKAQ